MSKTTNLCLSKAVNKKCFHVSEMQTFTGQATACVGKLGSLFDFNFGVARSKVKVKQKVFGKTTGKN